MSQVNPPIQYFPTIIYNPQFWTSSSSSALYLGRTGTPTSIATNTTFTGTLTTNGITNTGTITTTDLTCTNVIQGTALNSNNAYSTNNNANATHYLTFTDLSTNGYGQLQKHATLTFNPNTEVLTAENIVATQSMTSITPATSDNSTKVATTAFVKAQPAPSSLLTSDNSWSGQNTFSKLTYSNISTSIPLVNADFQLPLKTPITFTTLATGSTTYAPNDTFLTSQGFTGWGISGTSYTIGIQCGTGSPTYYFTYFPVGNQCLILQGSPATLISQNYSLTAGQYIFTFQVQSQGMGNLVVSAMKGGTTIASTQTINVNANYPNWITYTLAFSVPTIDNYFFKFALQGGYVGIYVQSLIIDNCIVITNGVNTSCVGGSQSILHDVFVNNGLNIVSGGLDVVGSVNMGTAFGTNCLAINSIMGAISSTNTSCLAIGTGALQNSTNSTSVIAIGVASSNSTTSATRCVAIGNNLLSNSTDCTLVGFGCNSNSRLRNTLIGSNIANNGGAGVGDDCIAIGSNIFNGYNGFGTVSPDFCVAIGNQSQRVNGDNFNTSVGHNAFLNMDGLGFGIAYNTQYNSSLGYNSGSTYARFNQCTFLGANTDLLANNLTGTTCIGYNTKCATSSTIQLGSNSETVAISGSLKSGSNTITATQLGYLSALASAMVDTTTNQSISGNKTLTGTTQIDNLNYNTIYTPFSVGTITATGTLGTPLNGTYIWDASASYTITMPVITSAMIGIMIRFRRITNSNTNTLNIVGGTGNSVIATNATTAVANPSSTVLLTGTGQPLLGFYQSITCINSTTWAIMG